MKRARAAIGALTLLAAATVAQAAVNSTVTIKPGAAAPTIFCTVVSGQPPCGYTQSSSGLGASLGVAQPLPNHTYYLSLKRYTAQDKTGTGNGWHITFQATPFTCIGNSSTCTSSDPLSTFPYGSMKMLPPTVACDTGLLCTGRESRPSISLTSASVVDAPQSVTVASACNRSCASGPSGMGTYNFTPGNFTSGSTVLGQLQLTTGSSNWYAVTYSSTLTMSIVSGPSEPAPPPTAPPSVSIVKGWNLIDVPGQNSGIASLADITTSINNYIGVGTISAAATYRNGRFLMYVPGYSANAPLSSTQGVFVLSTTSGTWVPPGSVYTSGQVVNLARGWNLVAAPYPTSGLATDVIAGQIGSAVVEIATYSGGTYKVYLPGSSPPFLVTATSGMWIQSTAAVTWTPH